MPEFFAVERRRTIREFWGRVSRMLEAVRRQRKQRLYLPDSVHPHPQSAAVCLAPMFRRECNLHGIHERSIQDSDCDIVP